MQKIKFINATMDLIHNLANELYEAIVDDDFVSVERIVKDLDEVIKDINQIFKNEI